MKCGVIVRRNMTQEQYGARPRWARKGATPLSLDRWLEASLNTRCRNSASGAVQHLWAVVADVADVLVDFVGFHLICREWSQQIERRLVGVCRICLLEKLATCFT